MAILRKRLTFIMLLIMSINSIVYAGTLTESEALTQLFAKGPASMGYTKQFTAAAPLPVMEQYLTQITQQVGTFEKVEGTSNPYTAIFENGTVTVYISLDSQGNIAGIQFAEIIASQGTLSDAVKVITDLDAETAVLIRKNGKTLVAHQADIPLAVGSAFKLGVLAALEDAVQTGRLRWDQSISLDSSWKSLPSGILQDWPSGTSITIETLAILMISQSDNTATDTLMSILGRDKVEAYLPHSIPTLTTGEMFRLKNPDNDDLLSRYRAASLSGKRASLDELKTRDLPSSSLFSGDPIALDVEWFMTVTELSDLIERLQDLDPMTVNPGLALKEHWYRIAYKGGSEPGVLNLTTFLMDEAHNRYTVSVTVNNPDKPLDDTMIMGAYQTILNYLQ
ncbi:MAG: serine hydrolase [Sphaerochaetaceae bacterium]